MDEETLAAYAVATKCTQKPAPGAKMRQNRSKCLQNQENPSLSCQKNSAAYAVAKNAIKNLVKILESKLQRWFNPIISFDGFKHNDL